MAIQLPGGAEFSNGVLHHETLYGQRPPAIKNRQSPVCRLPLQVGLGQQQPFDHPRPQPEGTALGAIGGAELDVGMGLEAPELGG
jgi:hypothetical protein